ncbi:MAG: DUF3450 family protein [Myxococcota bacterium]
MRVPQITTLALLCVSFSTPALASDLEKMAAELARLRSEVETLTTDLDEMKADEKQKLQAYAQQKASLESEAQREELRLKQAQQELERIREKIREAGALEQALKPAVLAAMNDVKGPVRSGLPFRVDERIKDLEKLEKQLEADELLPSEAASRLWSRVEDELRLARENGMYQQVIDVDGREVLADVARVGMTMLFFRTEDQSFGRAVRSGSGWAFETYTDEAQMERAKALFEALEKRIRVGFFEIPNALTEAR